MLKILQHKFKPKNETQSLLKQNTFDLSLVCARLTIELTTHTTQNQSGGGDTAQENVFRCSHLGGDDSENSKIEGRTPHKIKVGCWLAGWLG